MPSQRPAQARPSPLSRSSGRDRRPHETATRCLKTVDRYSRAEFVVEAHRFVGLQDVRRDAPVLEELQGFGADLQGLEDALGGAAPRRRQAGPRGGGGCRSPSQSHARAPPGQSFASLKLRPPSTSMRPQERCVMRGERPFPIIGLSAAARVILPDTQERRAVAGRHRSNLEGRAGPLSLRHQPHRMAHPCVTPGAFLRSLTKLIFVVRPRISDSGACVGR
jgi:hypothetical protein